MFIRFIKLFALIYSLLINALYAQTQVWDRAKELIEKNNEEDAVKVLTDAYIKFNKSKNSEPYVARIIGMVKEYDLEAKMLGSMSPEEAASPRKWFNYYHLTEMLDAKEEKQRALKHLKNLRVVPQSYRLSLAIALYEEDSERAIVLLKGHPDKQEVIQGLSRSISKQASEIRVFESVDFEKIDAYVNLLELFTEYCATLDNSFIIGDSYQLGGILNNLYCPIPVEGFDEDLQKHAAVLDKYKDKILMLYSKIAEKALLNPWAADRAFSRLHVKYSADNKLKDLEKILVDSFLTIATDFVEGDLNLRNTYAYANYSWNDYDIYPVSRFQFLGEMMFREKSVIQIDDAMIEALSKIDINFAERLKFLKSNILLSDKEFEKQLSELDEKNIADLLHWDEFLRVRKNDECEKMLLGAILKAPIKGLIWSNKNSNTPHPQKKFVLKFNEKAVIHFVPRIVNSLGKSKAIDLHIMAYIKRLSFELIGDVEEEEGVLEAWVKRHDDQAYITRMNFKYQFFNALLSEMLKLPHSAKYGVDIMDEVGYPCSILGLRSDLVSFEVRHRKNIDWIKHLEKMNILVGPDEVRVKVLRKYDEALIAKLAAKYRFLKHDQSHSMLKTDWDVMFYSISNRYGSETKESLIKDLSKIDDERQLSAQVSLVLLEEKSLDKFCKTFAKEINESSHSFKHALIDVFDLKENTKNKKSFTSSGIKISLNN